MKTLIFALCFVLTLGAKAQVTDVFETFSNGTPAGWKLGQGMSVTDYENPLFGCSENFGASTTNIGNGGTSYIVTPELFYQMGTKINVSFRIFVFNANIKCVQKSFPCDSYVKIYVVKDNYSGTTTPPASVIIYQSPYQLLLDPLNNNLNSLVVPASALAAVPHGTLYRIYIDFNTPVNCNQSNTRYVMDDIKILPATQSTLPVKISSFTATRKNQQVNLNWETSTEIENKGFTVQSKVSNANDWRDIAFVASKANGGNSNSVLSYNYSDVNITEGTIQYRLKQTDLDGRFEYSDVRSVKTEKSSMPVLLYPNPAKGGKVNIALDNASTTYEIMLTDATGKTIKTYNNYNGSNLTIEGLSKGFYLVTVKDLSTREIFTEKLIVKD
jgi:hypothetical protein